MTDNIKEPIVSVVMASFNENTEIITGAVNSIIGQTFTDWELLIADDSTNEDTKTCIDNFTSDSRIKVIRKDKRMGLSGARNVALSNAKGRYVAIMDADDFSLPERFEKQVNYLDNNPKCYVLGGQMNIMDENSAIVSSRHYPLKGFKLKLFAAFRNPIAHPTVMFRKELFDKGFSYDETLKMSEDLDLWLRIMNAGYGIENLSECVINYRVGSNFVDKRTSDAQVKYMADVRRKCFSGKHFFFSCMSVCAGFIFEHTPKGVIKKIYKKENSDNK